MRIICWYSRKAVNRAATRSRGVLPAFDFVAAGAVVGNAKSGTRTFFFDLKAKQCPETPQPLRTKTRDLPANFLLTHR